MNVFVPAKFREVSKEEFDYLMGNVDYLLSCWANGEYYEMRGKRVGIHLEDRGDKYFIDTETFKSV